MKGANTMIINQATMMAAVQMYLNSLLREPIIKVVGVNVGDRDTFLVRVEDVPPPPQLVETA